jgi:hypothetical protein
MAKPPTVHTVASLLARAEEEGACLLWGGSMGYHDTPQVYVQGEGMVATRMLLSRLLGVSARGKLYYGTSCGNPRCIAPEHIVMRKPSEHRALMRKNSATPTARTKRRTSNTVDRRAKPLKLSMETAALIRADERPSKEVAAQFAIHPSMVWKIRTGKAWADHTNPFAGLLAANTDNQKRAA